MLQQRLYALTNSGNLRVQIRSLVTTQIMNSTFKFRVEKGLPANPNKERLLRDMPDYTFLDGRLTPYGSRQKERILKEKAVCEQIVDLAGEIDFAIERHKQLQIKDDRKKQNILKRKFKPKGVALLNEK